MLVGSTSIAASSLCISKSDSSGNSVDRCAGSSTNENAQLRGTINAAVLPYLGGAIRFFPDSLKAATYLRFAQEMAGQLGVQRECEYCRMPFQPTRRDHRFCGKNCQERPPTIGARRKQPASCSSHGHKATELEGKVAANHTVTTLRLTCSTFWVEVRLLELNGRWIASADTPGGPSLGLGKGAIEAIEHALEPFEGVVDELLASLPRAGII